MPSAARRAAERPLDAATGAQLCRNEADCAGQGCRVASAGCMAHFMSACRAVLAASGDALLLQCSPWSPATVRRKDRAWRGTPLPPG